ncbi:transcriptional regulator [Tateyamaria omphalii]|uniref:IclR family transcriptional regulator n=1 Tax=Tateyamaria omphalii TaxID=299262 RepID=UPI001677AB7D|nr:IclR family transcriptional regulator [Tateyamaria omphalii]GGX65911.1 transcriptional regulator [Tateyamaria omphalii]
MSKNQGIQVISRAADILRLLGRETGGLSLGQIAKEVQLPRSTVQRIVAALGSEGFVSTERGDGGIRLGREIQSLALAVSSDMRSRLRPLMEQLSDETGETVDLAVLEGAQMLFVDQIEGSHRLRTVSRIGEYFPLTTTANGRAALACMHRERALTLIRAEHRSRGPYAPPLSDIIAGIDAIRDGALACDENEHTDGICAMGFAVVDQMGDIFAVSVPVPSSRYDRVKPTLADAVRTAISTLDA